MKEVRGWRSFFIEESPAKLSESEIRFASDDVVG
jgi:hypothetical protein